MPSVLTDREVQILKLIASALTNKEISRELSISESTVENHIHHIYTKLGFSNRAQAVIYGLPWTVSVPQTEMIENRGNPS